MAGASLFTLLDDISLLLDDVSLMTKVAAKKTAGVVGDDLALNANQVQGMAAAREWPVIWSVAKGSFLNKLILVPVALALSVWADFLIRPLLMIGGAYLCFEGAEKFLHARAHKKAHTPVAEPAEPLDEKTRIKGAVRTDFILSAEIIVIALGTVDPGTDIARRALVLSVIAIGMTVGVYGLVALIVKMDDLGLALTRRGGGLAGVGRGLLALAPRLMKFLSVAGTVAMFLVGGEILLHGIPGIHAPEGLLGMGAGLLTGLAVGFLLAFLVLGVQKLRGRGDAQHA
jgi:predicted DNA repair protein MutK